MFNTLTNSNSTIIILDASIKNNIVTSIVYIHTYNSPIIETIHHVTNIISTKAKLLDVE